MKINKILVTGPSKSQFIGDGVICNLGDCQGWVVSENKMNWHDAVGFCQVRNGTLIQHPTAELSDNVTDYWTAKQQRMSPWIHSIGCFNETVIQPLLNSPVTCRSPSVVHCQQRCSGFPFFGLQVYNDSRCVCLNEFPITTNAIDSSLCSMSCSESPNVVLRDCGGPKTYNIYKPGDLALHNEGTDNKTCLAIACGNDDVQPLSCSGTPNIRCRCTGIGKLTRFIKYAGVKR
ncbi:uncharacterized protein LOC125669016 [Ostrea edulis]|uniref:uncharacterized protein LOC125669016 n=1 Tax=Ostrea edulis TaxID=37623 RepID=UPI0024AFC62B|nr:uncharacterized protein LOC125669016 [Ostrea edulis]